MKFRNKRPLAITMWEFSWVERRWPGAGYEDWDKVLSELVERGYDAVRIDAFPHLMAADPYKEWTLKPQWTTQDWGSKSINRITLYDDFKNFLSACRRKGIKVALSTWFREDIDNTRMQIMTPQAHAGVWIKTLDYIREWGELDNILYVDLCNEFPLRAWAPFFTRNGCVKRDEQEAVDWMKTATEVFRKSYPEIPVTFSFTAPYDNLDEDMSYLDFLEPHVWMTNSSGFYEKVGYHFEQFDDIGYTNMALYGEDTYRANKEFYDASLMEEIEKVAEWSRRSDKPLITTECWSVVDYKDWPLLNWDWIKNLCEEGVRAASKTGRWTAMATSNFCGPQFTGMWSDVAWHRRLTDIIHKGEIPE